MPHQAYQEAASPCIQLACVCQPALTCAAHFILCKPPAAKHIVLRLQACGLVNDHTTTCFRHQQVQEIASQTEWPWEVV